MTQQLPIMETLLNGIKEIQTNKESVLCCGKWGNNFNSCFNCL